jgi:hypothetical protein
MAALFGEISWVKWSAREHRPGLFALLAVLWYLVLLFVLLILKEEEKNWRGGGTARQKTGLFRYDSCHKPASSSCPCQPCFKESFSTDKLVSKRYILLTAAHLRVGLWILSV